MNQKMDHQFRRHQLLLVERFQQGAPYGTGHAFLPPATKLRQGNVFTPVCHSVHTAYPPWADTPQQTPRQTPPPRAVHAGLRSTSERYASYWNAILLKNSFGRRQSQIFLS